MFVINRKAFDAAALFVGHDERYYLHGVYLCPDPKGGIRAVATDGNKIAIIRDPFGFADESAIIRPPSLSKAKKNDNHTLQIIDGMVNLQNWVSESDKYPWNEMSQSLIGIAQAERIDGTFPDYARVIPNTKSGLIASADVFNVKYIMDCINARNILVSGRRPTNLARTWQPAKDDNLSPAFISCGDTDHFDAAFIVMPIRTMSAPIRTMSAPHIDWLTF